jgi:hypothetical protein
MGFNFRAGLKIAVGLTSIRAGSKENPNPGHSINSFQPRSHFSDFGAVKSKMAGKPDCHCEPSPRGLGQGINLRDQYL